MVVAKATVKPPPDDQESTDEEENERLTGHISQSEYATWFGNAIVLGSIGTLALIVNQPTMNKQLNFISDIFVATAVAVLMWATLKYFFIGRNRLHWTSYIFLVFVLSTLAALLWLAAVL
jgi:hypothetical protein